jgi:hypothetical protein
MKKIKYLINFLSVLLLLVSSFLWNPQAAIADSTKTIVKEQKQVGHVSVRTWVKVDEKTRIPASIGITFTEAALEGLPQEKDPVIV